MRLMEIRRIDAATVEETYVDEDGNITINRICNVQLAIEAAKAAKDFAKGKDIRHVASLPPELIEHWRITEGFDWYTASETERKARLNDPDNRAFRVSEEHL